jgi:hypothetical protein
MDQECLFCHRLFEPEHVSDEHLIPEAMGGWIKNRLICTKCNNTFGATVDSVSNHPTFFHLRAEAGLNPYPIATTYESEGIDTPLEGRLTAAGEILDTRPVYIDEDKKTLLIVQPTPEQVDNLTRKISEARRSRGDPEFEIGDGPKQRSAGQAALRFEADRKEFAIFRCKLARLAAKGAIEHIGMVRGSAMALNASLDTIRNFAASGADDGADVGIVIHSLQGSYWLPKTKRVLVMSEAWSPDTGILTAGSQPPESTSLTQLIHGLAFSSGGFPHFEMILFSVFLVAVPIPQDVDLPWGDVVTRDLLTGKPADLP